MNKSTIYSIIALFGLNSLWFYNFNKTIAICAVFIFCLEKFSKYLDDLSALTFQTK